MNISNFLDLTTALPGWRKSVPATALKPAVPAGVLLFLSLALAGPVAAQSCVDDVTGVTNNCTAADVTLGLIFVPLDEGEEVVKCEAGQEVEVQLRAEIVAGAQTRYDIGMFIAEDGGNARTGMCFHDFIQPVEGKTCPESSSLDLGDMETGGTCFRDMEPGDTLDICGDVIAGESNFYDLNGGEPVTIICTPNPEDPTQVIVSHVVSWDNTSNNTCESVEDAVPNTRAKCNAGFSVVGNIEILVEPGIFVTKTADDPVVNIGDTSSYTIVVENTTDPNGETDLLNLVVTDNTCDADPVLDSCTAGSPAALPAGETCTYTCSVADVQADFCNTAIGTANPEAEPEEEVSDIGVACVTAVGGEIVVEKATDPSGALDIFEFTVVGPGFDNTEDPEELQDGQTFSTGTIAPGDYTVTESDIPDGWTLDGIDCGDATITGSTETSVTFELEAEQTVSCTFSNVQDGSLTVEKVCVGSDEGSFDFTASGDGLEDFALECGGSTTFENLEPGDGRSVEETAPEGFELTSAVCDDGSPVSNIDIEAGEAVTCTFTNTAGASLTIEKTCSGIEEGTTFDFTTSGDGLEDFSLECGGSITFGDLEAGDGRSVEETVPEGVVLSASCDDGSPTTNIDIEAGEAVTCTFNNSVPAEPPAPPEVIPTTSRIGLIALALLLMGLAGFVLTQRRRLSGRL